MTRKDRCHGISLGLIAGDALNLRGEAKAAKSWGADILHFDIMDGVFVPQFTAGPSFTKGYGDDFLIDVHLMIQRPADHVANFVLAGAHIITIHAESEGAEEAIAATRKAAEDANHEVIVGLSIMPGTSLDQVDDLLACSPDLFLVLALDPRDGTSADISAACERVHQARKLLPDAVIAFDGGVTGETMKEIMATAPDMVVSGSAIMRAEDRTAAFAEMAAHFEN